MYGGGEGELEEHTRILTSAPSGIRVFCAGDA